jgi:hypothetical protein
VKRLVYILSHGVKEGLVSEVKKWPGLSCVQALLEGGTASFHRWRNWTRRWKMEVGEGINVGRFSKNCPSDLESLVLSPLPCWAGLSGVQRGRLVAQLVADIDAKAPNKAAVRAKHIAQQDPHHKPRYTKLTHRPRAHASSTARWIEAVHRYRAFVAAFRRASSQWLAGIFDVEFPPHSFRPPPWAVPPRIV